MQEIPRYPDMLKAVTEYIMLHFLLIYRWLEGFVKERFVTLLYLSQELSKIR